MVCKLSYHSLSVSVQDCSHIDEHGIAAALLPLVTAYCRVSSQPASPNSALTTATNPFKSSAPSWFYNSVLGWRDVFVWTCKLQFWMLRHLKCLFSLINVSSCVCLTEIGRRHYTVCLQLRTGAHGMDHHAVLGGHVLQRRPEPHQGTVPGDGGRRAAEPLCEHIPFTRYFTRANKEMMNDLAHCKKVLVNVWKKICHHSQ